MSTGNQALLSPYHAYRAHYQSPPTPLPSYVAAASYPQYQYQHQQRSLSHDSSVAAQGFSGITNAYMNPTLPQPPLQHSFSLSPRHGIKRNAPDPDDEFERSSHIATQFKKLRLNNQQQNNSQQSPQFNASTTHFSQPSGYSPAPANAITAPSSIDKLSSINHEPTTSTSSNSLQQQQQQQQSAAAGTLPTLPSNDFMTVDETPNKIYISDLDSEIAAIEAAERLSSSQIFLPDFEKQIGAIPDHILRSSDSSRTSGQSGSGDNHNPPEPANNQALVLYQEPSSISVPEEEDAVRKAVLEARRGIREKMRRQSQRDRETAHIDLANMNMVNNNHVHTPSVLPTGNEDDNDNAMDMMDMDMDIG